MLLTLILVAGAPACKSTPPEPEGRAPGGLYRMESNLKAGYMDTRGKIVIPPQFDGAASSFSEGLAAVVNDQRLGYIDETGKVVIPLQYEKGTAFKEDRAFVLNPGAMLWSLIDKTGKVIADAQFPAEEGTQFSDGYVMLRDGPEYCYYDRDGKKKFGPYTYAEPFSEGMACVAKDSKYNWIDTNGSFVFSAWFARARSFTEGMAAVSIKDWSGPWGFIDKTGKMVIAPVYEQTNVFREGVAAVKTNNVWTFIDKTGAEVLRLPPDVFMVDDMSEDRFVAWKDDRMSIRLGAYFGRDGKQITPFRFAEAVDFRDGIAWAVSGMPPFAGYIDKTGTPVWSAAIYGDYMTMMKKQGAK